MTTLSHRLLFLRLYSLQLQQLRLANLAQQTFQQTKRKTQSSISQSQRSKHMFHRLSRCHSRVFSKSRLLRPCMPTTSVFAFSTSPGTPQPQPEPEPEPQLEFVIDDERDREIENDNQSENDNRSGSGIEIEVEDQHQQKQEQQQPHVIPTVLIANNGVQQPYRTLIDIYPAFNETVAREFPGTVPLEEYFEDTTSILMNNHKFEDDNTMGIAAICRDEIVEPFFTECVRNWGKTFNCCSLAGFLTMGKTGLAAASHHAPIDPVDKLRRFVFLAMPHIAISRHGEIGVVYREGIEGKSSACGALMQIVNELRSGQLNLKFDTDDIEQSLVRQKVLSEIDFSGDTQSISLSAITKIAARIIADDVESLLDNHLANAHEFEYAVLTGVQIHGPHEHDFVWPFDNYLVSPTNVFNGKKKQRLNPKTRKYEPIEQ